MDLMRAFMWVIKSAPDVAFLIGMGGFGFGLFSPGLGQHLFSCQRSLATPKLLRSGRSY